MIYLCDNTFKTENVKEVLILNKMISTNSIILTVIAFYIITSYLIFYNVHSRIEKVIDEEFHIPQGLAYCNFNFSAVSEIK